MSPPFSFYFDFLYIQQTNCLIVGSHFSCHNHKLLYFISFVVVCWSLDQCPCCCLTVILVAWLVQEKRGPYIR